MFVADLRAPTPTGAAEMAVPDQHEIKRMLEKTKVQLKRALSQRLDRQEETLSYLLNHPVFRYPSRVIDPFEKALTHLSHRLSKQTPIDRVERLLETFKTQKKALNHAFESRLKTLEFRLESRIQSIKLNSPQTRLEQG
jgi:Exonuclease VII, large subunit